MTEGPPPRSVFFELRGVLWVIVLAFLVFQHQPVSPRLWLLGTVFLISDLIVLCLPRAWFHNPRLGYGLFLADTTALTILLYSIRDINPELVLLYYLTIFMAMLNSNLRRSVQVGFVAGLVYVGLYYLHQHGNFLREPSNLPGIPLFFAPAVSCPFLAQQIQSYKRTVQHLQRVQEGLEGEIARTT